MHLYRYIIFLFCKKDFIRNDIIIVNTFTPFKTLQYNTAKNV